MQQLHAGYDPFAADVWSFGITLFTLVTNRAPFARASPDNAVYRAFVRCTAPHTVGDFLHAPWLPEWQSDIQEPQPLQWKWSSRISPALKHLLQHCLAVRPAERLTIEQVAAHPWFNDPTWQPQQQSLEALSPVVVSVAPVVVRDPELFTPGGAAAAHPGQTLQPFSDGHVFKPPKASSDGRTVPSDQRIVHGNRSAAAPGSSPATAPVSAPCKLPPLAAAKPPSSEADASSAGCAPDRAQMDGQDDAQHRADCTLALPQAAAAVAEGRGERQVHFSLDKHGTSNFAGHQHASAVASTSMEVQHGTLQDTSERHGVLLPPLTTWQLLAAEEVASPVPRSAATVSLGEKIDGATTDTCSVHLPPVQVRTDSHEQLGGELEARVDSNSFEGPATAHGAQSGTATAGRNTSPQHSAHTCILSDAAGWGVPAQHAQR